MRQLADENHTLRRKNKQQRVQLEKLEPLAKKAPPEGAVVLTKEQGEAWTAFQALKKTPKEVQDALTAGEKAITEVAQIQRTTTVDEAAGLVKYNRETLRELVRDKNLTIELREENVTEDGETKKVKVPYVKPNTEGAQATKLVDYATNNLKPYLPALSAVEGEDGEESQGTTGKSTQKPGKVTKLPSQKKGGDTVATGADREELKGARRRTPTYSSI